MSRSCLHPGVEVQHRPTGLYTYVPQSGATQHWMQDAGYIAPSAPFSTL